jgi:hypothetical protein
MDTEKQTAAALVDFKVHVKLKLSALWIAVMLCYIYGDIFKLQQPGSLEALIAGKVWSGGPLTQGMLLAFAVSMAIPSAMVFLSLVLKPNANRWTNVILGAVYTVFLLLTLPGAWHFYIFLAIVETALTLLIVWHAWKWPKREVA